MLHTLTLAAIVALQPAGTQPTLRCWPANQRDAVVEFEKTLIDACSPEKLREWHDLLGSEPHIAGTPGDERTIQRIADAFTAMGLAVERHDFWPLLCRPTALTLEVVSPERVPLFAKEEILKEDPYSAHPELLPGWNAYSGSGDVTAEVVYANYGTREDYRKLAELGVDVRGKIVLARYGANFRGYKAKYAQEAGAAGLIIYTDPADSGYCKGLMYPEGGYANSSCIQRGSLITLPYVGDPLTPGVEATEHAERLDVEDLDLPTIPVTPIGWGSAQQIVGRMKGPPVPPGWQGGLPFPYRLTGGPDLKVRLHVEQERFIARTSNVIARLEGAAEPDKLVIIGCHHDAWGFGASDPLAGTICLMECARVLSEAAHRGNRPARTILFCAWGAEEFGIIGSTEWVEANRENLLRNAVCYINLDMASMGPDFGASATPSMQRVIADAARLVPQARGTPGQTVFDAWIARSKDPLNIDHPSFGSMGGGSDHAAFVNIAGVASAGLSAGGSQGTAYHSTYDTLQWYRQTVGDDYEPALMIARIAGVALHRLAFAPIVPLDPARYATEMGRALDGIAKRADELKWRVDAERFERTRERAAASLTAAHLTMDSPARDSWSDAEWARQGSRVNDALIGVDRAWLDEAGLPNRPWYRNLFIAPDEYSGYASWPLPAVRRAVEEKDASAFDSALERLDAALGRVP